MWPTECQATIQNLPFPPLFANHFRLPFRDFPGIYSVFELVEALIQQRNPGWPILHREPLSQYPQPGAHRSVGRQFEMAALGLVIERQTPTDRL
jgi:hypothetical protein